MVRVYTYLEPFLDNLNKSVGLSEFESHFNTPHQTVKKHLSVFTESGALKEEKKKRLLSYSLDLKNPLTREYLIICEKERLFNFLEKNTLFRRLYETVSPFFGESRILIFGSAVGEKRFNDIDVLVLGGGESIKKELAKFGRTYSVKFHIIQTRAEDLSPAFISELRKKHIIFNSHESFLEVLYDEHKLVQKTGNEAD